MSNSFFSKYSEIICFKAKCDLKVENSKARLGFLWWYLEPALYLLAFYSIKSVIFVDDNGNRLLFLLTGIVFWRWFDSSVRKASTSLLTNASLVTQVDIPKLVFPCISILAMAYRFFILLTIFIVLVLVVSGINTYFLYLPVVMLAEFVLICGVCLFLSAIVPFFPDLKIIINNLMTAMFFCSGIFFDIAKLEESVRGVLYLNPMAKILVAMRDIFILAVPPKLEELVYVAVVGVVFGIVGLYIHKNMDHHYPKILAG